MRITEKIKIDIYGCTLTLIVCDDLKKETKALYKKFNEFHKEDLGDDCAMAFTPDINPALYFMVFPEGDIEFNTIVHECTHIAEWILSDRGAKAEGEQLAYLNGFIGEKVWKFLNKHKIKII